MTQKFPNTEIQMSEHSIIRWPCLTQKHRQEGAVLLTADSVCRYGTWKNCHAGQRFRIPFLPKQLVGPVPSLTAGRGIWTPGQPIPWEPARPRCSPHPCSYPVFVTSLRFPR